VLIVFAGPACSGKSTLAAEVARRHGWPHLSMDATRQRLMPGAGHTRAHREVAYRAMLFAAELLLAAGASVILDAPYGHAEDRAELAGKLLRLGIARPREGVNAAALVARYLSDDVRRRSESVDAQTLALAGGHERAITD